MTQRNALVMNSGQVQQLQAGDCFLTGQGPGRRNAIINGNFDIWQRDISIVLVQNVVTYTSDRWSAVFTSGGGITIGDGTQPTVAQSGTFSASSLVAICTTAGTLAVGDFTYIKQSIEGYNFRNLAQRPMTLSFWVNSVQTGTFCIALVNGGNDRSYVAEYTVSAANTWQKVIIHIPASPSAGTWNYTNGVGLQVVFCLGAGATFQTTPNAWQTGQFYGTANQTNFLSSTTDSFTISQVQIEQGDAASDFERQMYPAILADCQRYYWLGGMYICGGFSSAVNFEAFVVPAVPMRATPTGTLTTSAPVVVIPSINTLTGAGSTLGVSAGAAHSSFSNSFHVTINGFSAAATGHPAQLNDNYLQFDAEL